MASILGVGLLSLVGLAYGRKDMSMKVRLLAWLTSGFLLIAIVQTGARGNLLALILALIALTVKPSAIAERMKTILIALIVIVSLAVASYQIDAVRERWERTYYEGDVAGRQVLLPAAWGMFLEKPIMGWGPVSQSYEMASSDRYAERRRAQSIPLVVVRDRPFGCQSVLYWFVALLAFSMASARQRSG